MIYDYIDDLVEAIKAEAPYQDFIAAKQKVTEDPQLTKELNTMQRLLDEKEDLSKYQSYISLDEINEKIKAQKQVLQSFPAMIDYQSALYTLNKQLEELSQITFGGISEELIIGRIGKIYARHSRSV